MAIASETHLERRRGISRDEALRELCAAIDYARSIGFEDIMPAAEDATRTDREFLRSMLIAAIDAGATSVCIPDTVGCCLPEEYGDLIRAVRCWVGPSIRITAHTHNDLGLAVANTLDAIEAGADECQVTLSGIGERAGNAALEQVVAAMIGKRSHFGRDITIDSRRLVRSCTLLAEILKRPLAAVQPVVGANAFSAPAGIHHAAILQDPKTYEFLDPDWFGASRRIAAGYRRGPARV